MSSVRVCVFGGVALVDDGGRRRDVGGPRPRLILAMLAGNGGTPVPDDVLADAIWGDHPPPSARTALQTYVSALRDDLEPDRPRRSPGRFIRLEPTGYRLDTDHATVDVGEFSALIDRARRLHLDDPAVAADCLDQALALWREPVLGEFVDEPWALGIVTRLRDAHAGALESRFGLALEDGTEAAFLDRMDAAVRTYPYRERLAGQRMLALYRSGRQRRALEQYEATRAILRDDLGLDPGRELQLLERAVLAHDPSLVNRRSPATMPPAARRPERVSTGPRALAGRDEELDRVADVLRHERCVTVVGPGGVGKSALASAVADRVDARFDGRVVHVDLAELGGRDPMRAVAVALRVVEHPLAPLAASVTDALGEQPALVVLHTCEARLGEVADVVVALLDAPATRVLATSQVPLHLAAERVVRLEPLPTDAAVTMLGGDGRPDDERRLLAQIAERVDRLPLGLELARSRLDVLGPSELLRRLDDDDLLVGGADRPARQRSVQSAVTWSVGLLDRAAGDALVDLCVLSAPFTTDVATTLGVDVAVVGDLVDRSLVQRLDTSPTRFRVADAVRDVARERADPGRVELARRRVAELCLEAAQARVFGGDEPVPVADLDGEFVDAVSWFAGHDDPRQLLLAGYLGTYFIEHGRISEGRELIGGALAAHPDAPAVIRLLMSSQLGFLTWYQGDMHATRRVLTDVGGLLDHAPTEEFRAVAIGCLAFSERRFDVAARELSAAAATRRGMGKQRLMVLHLAGNACWYAGRPDDAQRWYREQRDVARELDDLFHLAQSLRFEAMLTAQTGDIEPAWRWAHRSLSMAHEMNDALSLAQSTAASAIVASLARVDDEAIRFAADAVEIGMRQFDVFALRTAVPVLADVARRRADEELAARLLGWYHDLLERTGQTSFPATEHLRGNADELRASFGPARFAQLAAEGATSRIVDTARAVVRAAV